MCKWRWGWKPVCSSHPRHASGHHPSRCYTQSSPLTPPQPSTAPQSTTPTETHLLGMAVAGGKHPPNSLWALYCLLAVWERECWYLYYIYKGMCIKLWYYHCCICIVWWVALGVCFIYKYICKLCVSGGGGENLFAAPTHGMPVAITHHAAIPNHRP